MFERLFCFSQRHLATSRPVSLLLAAVVLLLCSETLRAQDTAVVRLSYVNGSVQISKAGAVQFDKAVANMPLFQGSQVVTQADGEAEIEFADGSVARLTPNSSLQLSHLQNAGASGHTDLDMMSGLAYFELNVGQGQRFSIRLGTATARPEENSIFRVSLDKAPEVAVFQGVLHVDGQSGAFTTEVNERESVSLDSGNPAQYNTSEAVRPDSWDQWNMDRDDAIAREASAQTDARDDSAAPQDPGWNDLDANGNWYPVDGYGNVWVPAGTDANWDPYGYGYWANYPASGTTWISGYPWGWLPYHCGAWNYFSFGWGWIPGGCGLGWSPIGTIWNAPQNYRRPIVPRGGVAVASRARYPSTPTLFPVDRGAIARGPWASGFKNEPGAGLVHTGASAQHAPTLHLDGNTIAPLAKLPAPSLRTEGNRETTVTGAHVGIPVARPDNRPADNDGQINSGRVPMREMPNGRSNEVSRPPVATRPTYTPPPAPRYEPPPPPHVSAPAPAPAGRPH